MENNVNTDLIRDHVDSFIMRFLSNGASYGYDIHKAISTSTEGVYELKQPTLYSCLKRLEKQGFITSYEGTNETNGAQRRYYELTDAGRDFLKNDIEQWEFSRTLLDRLLSNKEFDLANAPKPFDPTALRPRTKRVKQGSDEDVTEEISAESAPIAEDNNKPINNGGDFDNLDYGNEDETPAETTKKEDSSKNMTDFASLLAQKFEERKQNTKDEDHKYSGQVLAEQIDLTSYTAETERLENVTNNGFLKDFLAQNSIRDDDYRNQLDSLLIKSANSNANPRPTEVATESAKPNANSYSYGELKEHVQSLGYKLNPYSKASTSSYYSMNFIFSTKLKRDTLLLSYLFMIVELLIAYFALDKFAGLGYLFYLITGVAMLVFPIFGIISYLIKPDKRIRAEFDLKMSLSGTLAISINAFIIAILFAFFLFGSDLAVPQTMVVPILYPALLLLNLPVGSIIYALLYQTKHYHLK